jgi:hypothetical protein
VPSSARESSTISKKYASVVAVSPSRSMRMFVLR